MICGTVQPTVAEFGKVPNADGHAKSESTFIFGLSKRQRIFSTGCRPLMVD
jgi:hypothetical protein